MGMREFCWDEVLNLMSPDPMIIGSEGGLFVHCLGLSFVSRVNVCALVASLTYWNAPLLARTDPPSPTRILLLLFAKLRKVTISFVTSVRLPVHKEQLGSH